jgi:hypothetical protein
MLFLMGFDIPSKCRMASIELGDAMILPHAANLDGSHFRKGQVKNWFTPVEFPPAGDVKNPTSGIAGRCARAASDQASAVSHI